MTTSVTININLSEKFDNLLTAMWIPKKASCECLSVDPTPYRVSPLKQDKSLISKIMLGGKM